ncbi:MAG: Fe-S cluster assembly ATPase SufC [Gammaproteobacteria bacterium]
MLSIRDLSVSADGNTILEGLSLDIAPGEVHAIMGPNGSGKSTLSRALIGDESYDITAGTVRFDNHDLLALSIEERAQRGVFLSFQYPISIPGVSNAQFLKASVNQIREARGLEPLDAIDMLDQAKDAFRRVGLKEEFISRPVNDGFSGGEKKRNELAQMLLMKPRLVILDEIDSGLDIDALRIVADCVSSLKQDGTSFLIITHNQRLLSYVPPERVHILMNGHIERSGDAQLAMDIEAQGYQHPTPA